MATQVTLVAPGLGTAPVPATADAAGNYIVPGSAARVILRIANASVSSMTVTLDDVNSTGPSNASQFNADVVVTVPASSQRYVKLVGRDLARFKDNATGRISWTYSAATSVTVEASSV